MSLLLMRYFYQTKRLQLPGLGVFTLDKNAVVPQELENQGEMPNEAQFQRVSVPAADPELIQFISENTGKIKPLASADLESFLGLGIEMLNIGKPFLLEGIGTITRQPTGKFDFSPGYFGLMPVESPEKTPKRSGEAKKAGESAPSEMQNTTPGVALTGNHNLLRFAALVAAVLIACGGGYMLYRHHSPSTGFSDTVAVAGVINPEEKAIVVPASEPPVTPPPVPAPVIKPADSAELKFVILSTPNKAHALRRYNQLQAFDLKPKLFQKDSAWFKVYFSFPARLKDTVHIKDSLRRQYDANVSFDR